VCLISFYPCQLAPLPFTVFWELFCTPSKLFVHPTSFNFFQNYPWQTYGFVIHKLIDQLWTYEFLIYMNIRIFDSYVHTDYNFFYNFLKNILQINLKLMSHARFEPVNFRLLTSWVNRLICYKIINVVIYNTKIFNVYLIHM